MSADQSPLRYGGFWVRAAAGFLDLLVNLPVVLFILWAGPRYRLFQLYFFLPWMAIGVFYNVYLVRRFGGTPGKLIMGLRIRKKTGDRIGYRQAVIRYAPEVCLGTLGTIAVAAALFRMGDTEFYALSPRERVATPGATGAGLVQTGAGPRACLVFQ